KNLYIGDSFIRSREAGKRYEGKAGSEREGKKEKSRKGKKPRIIPSKPIGGGRGKIFDLFIGRDRHNRTAFNIFTF
ncbi:MAG: hypothetical protein LBU28_04065, partial [Spirochaetaceae bacterium]|nr:hypothetical protein [Spirochaetaceae bacterium]